MKDKKLHIASWLKPHPMRFSSRCILVAAVLFVACDCSFYSDAAVLKPLPSTTTSLPDKTAQQESPAPLKEAAWDKNLERGNETLAKLIEAISGKKNSEETTDLLKGVVRVSRGKESFEFLREDDRTLTLGTDTAVGDRMVRCLEKTAQDTKKYGGKLEEVVTGLKGVAVSGNHVEVIREGPQEISIKVGKGVRLIPVRLKEVQIGRLMMDVDESMGFPAVKNISGINVVVTVGVDLDITLREFWRTKNNKGDTTVTFGIVNPLPKPVRLALGLKELTYFRHTVRKK